MILTVLGVIPIENADEMPRYGWPLLALMGAAFTVVGGTLVFGRSWTTIDITQRLVIKEWGPLIPLRQRTYPLTGYTAVILGFVQGDSDTADRFPVGLNAPAGTDLSLCNLTTYAQSRECAVAVAKHLQLDVEDATTDHRVRVSPAEADRSIRQRPFEPTDASVARPPGARSQVSREAGVVRIDIPPPRMHPIEAVVGLIPIAIPIVLVPWLRNFFRHTNTPDAIGWIFLTFVTFCFGFLPAMIVVNAFRRSRRGGTVILVSPTGIEIQERGAWRTRSTASIDASDILDIDYSTRESAIASARQAAEQQARESTGTDPAAAGPRMERLMRWLSRITKGRGLTVKTRTGLTTFGGGLENDEVRYLHAILTRALHG